MSECEFTQTVGGYSFKWPDRFLSIDVRRLHEKAGHITGEVAITTEAPGYGPLLHRALFNFSSTTARRQLIKEMESKYEWVPWPDVLEALCDKVLDAYRQGQPVQELWTNEPAPAPEWLLKPILYKGLPTIIFGEKTTCKSLLALVAYSCLTLPWVDNPLGWQAPNRPIRTLLLDNEVDYDIAHFNINRIQQGMNLPHFPLYYRRCAMPLADDLEQIQEHMEKVKAEALIIDSLGAAVGGDLLAPKEALGFNTALRQLHCAALIIGQTSKEREKGNKSKSVFGSTYFEYYARNIFELRKVQEEGEDDLDVAMYNTYHNLGRKNPAMGFHLHFSDDDIGIESVPITAPELIARLSTQAQILKILRSGPMSITELMEDLDVSGNAVRVAMSKLSKKGKVVKGAENKWGLVYEL